MTLSTFCALCQQPATRHGLCGRHGALVPLFMMELLTRDRGSIPALEYGRRVECIHAIARRRLKEAA